MTTHNRRSFLSLFARAAALMAAVPALAHLSGCRGAVAPPAELHVLLSDLPEGTRVRRKLGKEPLELTRKGDEITVRSLVCTHQGCTVVWREEQQQYICPCHEGRFDADGQFVYGSPRKPLRTYSAQVVGNEVVVGGMEGDGA